MTLFSRRTYKLFRNAISIQAVFLITASIFAFSSPSQAATPSLDFRVSFDSFLTKQSDLEGTNGISLLKHIGSHSYWGSTIYSAALGHAGGFFVGGFQVGRIIPLPHRFFLDSEFYLGGGGGASQVPGSGLMLRPRVSIGKSFEGFSLMLGPSWVKITGSDISTASIELAMTTPLDLAYEGGHSHTTHNSDGQLTMHAVKVVARRYLPQSNSKRNSDEPLGNMNLAGIEFTLVKEGANEFFLQTNGVVHGDAEGYADWYLGVRRFLALGPLTLFTDASAGVGGGGAVDTGGGINLSANIGAQIPLIYALYAEPSIAYIYSPSGNFNAFAPTIKLGIPLNHHRNLAHADLKQASSRWQVSTGITRISENDHLRKSGVANHGSPSMMNVKIDTFVAKNTYLTGQAFTAFAGHAGGFQIGLLGFGQRLPLNEKWSVSGEVMLGAGGGAGIDTKGGALAAGNIDLDYALSDSLSTFIGVGGIRSVKNNGMRSVTYGAGLKFLFTLFH